MERPTYIGSDAKFDHPQYWEFSRNSKLSRWDFKDEPLPWPQAFCLVVLVIVALLTVAAVYLNKIL